MAEGERNGNVFDVLPEDVRREVRALARRRRFKRGEVVFHEGDPADALHVLVRGHVAIRTVTPLGDTVCFTVLGAGDTFGELSLLSDDGERAASAAAVEGAETLSLRHAEVARLRAAHPAVDQVLLSLLATALRRTNRLLLEALYEPADVRVLRRLVDLVESYGGGGDAPVTVPVTQDELAGLAGTTRPTVNRALRALEGDGVVALGRGRTEVLDTDSLRRRAR